jgi:hypothetical protein
LPDIVHRGARHCLASPDVRGGNSPSDLCGRSVVVLSEDTFSAKWDRNGGQGTARMKAGSAPDFP